MAQVAQGILDGRISILAPRESDPGALGRTLGFDEQDPDLDTFVGIDSETNDPPIGRMRQCGHETFSRRSCNGTFA